MTQTGTTARTPRSIRRHPSNGQARYTIEVRLDRGWVFVSSRTTIGAALDRAAQEAEAPQRAEFYGQWVRVRDSIDGVIEGTRQVVPVGGWN